MEEKLSATVGGATPLMQDHEREMARRNRFAFGRNWTKFLSNLTEEHVSRAEDSLTQLLGGEHLRGRTFLDIGCGSGLFSLAARRLGASVHSFDYDPDSVACTADLRRQYFPDDTNWKVEVGTILDKTYVESLGRFDLVYAWGVLHHTGKMWEALNQVRFLTRPGGLLAIAIYNDQGETSRCWAFVKKAFNKGPLPLRVMLLAAAFVRLWGPTFIRELLSGMPGRTWRSYHEARGMSPWRDVVDWVGGYPFEVAKPEAICEFFTKSPGEYELLRMKTSAGGLGCNEFVFVRKAPPSP